MAANFNPIYARTPDIQLGLPGATIGPTASTVSDASSMTGVYNIFQADATEGSYVVKVIFKPVSNGTGTAAATVIRLFYSKTANSTGGPSNTALIAELSTTAWTYSATLASPQYEIPVNMPMNPGHYLLASFGTATSAAQGFQPLVIAGKY